MALPTSWVRFPDRHYMALRWDLTPHTDDGFYFWALQYRLAGTDAERRSVG